MLATQQMRIQKSSIQQILKNNLSFHAYKIQLTLEMKPADQEKRRMFSRWILNKQLQDNDFTKIIFSNKAHFYLSGFVKKQNCRIWSSENHHQIQEREMHPQRVTVWCVFWAKGMIGPFFFEDKRG